MDKGKLQDILIAKESIPNSADNFFSADTFKNKKQTVDFEEAFQEKTGKKTQKTKKTVIETPNYDFIETNNTNKIDSKEERKKRYKKSKFRLKLACCVYGILATLSLGWVIGNTIYINNLQNSIQQTKYEINIVETLIKEAQLDNFKQVQSGEDTLTTTIIELEPQGLSEPTKIQPQTNWFDRFCNWLKNIFGG